jgi:hypothetical protein
MLLIFTMLLVIYSIFIILSHSKLFANGEVYRPFTVQEHTFTKQYRESTFTVQKNLLHRGNIESPFESKLFYIIIVLHLSKRATTVLVHLLKKESLKKRLPS